MNKILPCPICGKSCEIDRLPTGTENLPIYAIHCCGIETHGWCEQETIEKWNKIHRPLQWTDQQPTKVGWYWFIPKEVITFYDNKTEFPFPNYKQAVLDTLLFLMHVVKKSANNTKDCNDTILCCSCHYSCYDHNYHHTPLEQVKGFWFGPLYKPTTWPTKEQNHG